MNKIWTIGHSNHSYEQFLNLLRQADITAVADVRSSPFSRHQSQFNKDILRRELRLDKIDYAFLGDELGGRPKRDDLYCEGVADYEKMAKTPDFKQGLERVIKGCAKYRIALLCSEHDPIDCHRCLLVGRALSARGFAINHILFDGKQKTQTDIEAELLRASKSNRADFFPEEQMASAYRDRAKKVAFSKINRPSSDTPPASTEQEFANR
ncbi:DUF488 domain-containing protein [Bradyrhizobium oligotrophicum]|uniref:DUF488 domain-containing protein n=1 Tax=Bradyrhizobium oligotrophicum TaxID=44255 RepID=UPI003EBF59BB